MTGKARERVTGEAEDRVEAKSAQVAFPRYLPDSPFVEPDRPLTSWSSPSVTGVSYTLSDTTSGQDFPKYRSAAAVSR